MLIQSLKMNLWSCSAMNKTLVGIENALGFNKIFNYIQKIPLIKNLVNPYIYGDYEKKDKLALFVKILMMIKNIIGKIFYIIILYFISGFPYTIIQEVWGEHFISRTHLFYLVWLAFLWMGTYKNSVSGIDKDTKIMLYSFRLPYEQYHDYAKRALFRDRIIYALVIGVTFYILELPLLLIGLAVLTIFIARMYADVIEIAYILRKGFAEKNQWLETLKFFIKLVLPFIVWYFTSYNVAIFALPVYFLIVTIYLTVHLRNQRFMDLLEKATHYHIQEFDEAQITLANASLKGIETDELSDEVYATTDLERKKGYTLYNDIFIKRHRKLWFKPLRNTIVIYAGVLTIATLAYLILSSFGLVSEVDMQDFDKFLPIIIKIYLFGMYFTNLGEKLTKAYYLHGDYSLLHYAFYKRKENIWRQYLNRLKTLMLVNLVPGIIVIAFLLIWHLILPDILIVEDTVRTASSIILITLFFSIHSLTLYYLIQPFNKKLEAKSTLYFLVNFAVYMFVINADDVFRSNTGVMIVGAFILVYFVLSVILVKLFSHKTFKWKD